jgi:hypothetical protein|tara:strand:- start:74 stop:232 length:159 start_codon:yes stop_codon:yes gene_type:complete
LKTVSLRAEILCGNLKKVVLRLEGKNSFKNGQEVDFQFYTQKTAKNAPFWAA